MPPRLPIWARAVLLGLLPLIVLGALLLALRDHQAPHSLAGSQLAGARLVTGGICIEEAVDVSGSMTGFTRAREAAERELFTFARRSLDPQDEFSSAFFAGSAALALAPTPLERLDAPPSVPGGISAAGTNLAPAVDALDAARPAEQSCAVRALIVITDGQLNDGDQVPGALTRAGYTRVFAVIPSATGWSRPGDLPTSVEVHHFDQGGLTGRLAELFTDARPLDVVFGEILATLTGQTLRAS